MKPLTQIDSSIWSLKGKPFNTKDTATAVFSANHNHRDTRLYYVYILMLFCCTVVKTQIAKTRRTGLHH